MVTSSRAGQAGVGGAEWLEEARSRPGAGRIRITMIRR
jgi:hypothetical protein